MQTAAVVPLLGAGGPADHGGGSRAGRRGRGGAR